MKIYEYPFEIRDVVVIPMPKGAKVLTVQMQRKIPCMWSLVDPANDTEDFVFRIIASGRSFNIERGNYIGTIQDDNFVWHIFNQY